MVDKERGISISPEQIIFNAFIFFDAQKGGIDEESLITLCLASNCPNREIAIKILQNMVEAGKQNMSIIDHRTIYKPIKK